MSHQNSSGPRSGSVSRRRLQASARIWCAARWVTESKGTRRDPACGVERRGSGDRGRDVSGFPEAVLGSGVLALRERGRSQPYEDPCHCCRRLLVAGSERLCSVQAARALSKSPAAKARVLLAKRAIPSKGANPDCRASSTASSASGTASGLRPSACSVRASLSAPRPGSARRRCRGTRRQLPARRQCRRWRAPPAASEARGGVFRSNAEPPARRRPCPAALRLPR